jgi:hypothetical protein
MAPGDAVGGQGTARDFASFRKVAEAVAAKTEPEFTQL